MEHYSVKKDLGSSLWKQPTMMQVIETLNVENMWDSTLNFPLRKNLMVSIILNLILQVESIYLSE